MIRRLAPLLACALLFAQSLLEQADAAFRTGDLDRAVALAKKVLAADPSAIHAHLIAGVVAAQRNQWPECSRHFQAVKRLAPANPYSYFYLGQAALYQHQWEAAVREFTAAAARNYPDLDRLRVELALALVESGKPREAMASLEKVTPPSSGWPFAGQYYAVTGFAQGKLGQADGAIQAIRRAREIDALNPQYAEFLISTLLATNQNSVALAEAIQAQRRFPDHLEVQFLFGLASYYVTQGSFTRLALRNSREAGPDSPQTLLLAGLVSRQEGKQEEAAESFRKAAKAGLPDAHLLLGLVSRDTGDLEAAEREFREAERLNPNNGQVRLELGKILLGRGDTAGARARLERAVELMPGASPAHYQLAVLYGRLGLQEKAAEHLATYRQLQKQEAESAGAARPQQ